MTTEKIQKALDALTNGSRTWDAIRILQGVLGQATAPEQQALQVWRLVQTPITENMHVAACKVLLRANGLEGLPQRMLDAMLAASPAAPEAAKPEQRLPQGWLTPTTYRERFSDAVALMCGTPAPDDMIDGWLSNEDERLQVFAIDHAPAWAQGIVLLEAAQLLAETPAEGVGHEAAPEAAKPETERSELYDYKTLYEEALAESNAAGYVGLTAAETIRIMAADSKAGGEPVAGWMRISMGSLGGFRKNPACLLPDGDYPLYTRPQQQAKPLTEKQLVNCIVAAGCLGTVKLSFESGPYGVDRPTLNATKLCEAIERAHGIGNQA